MTPDILAPAIRVLLRYLGGFLIAHGYAHSPDTFADPDLVQALCYAGSFLCIVVSEGWYYLAKKFGWMT